jgi:XTP/dITP diphosphohydrolase
VRRLQELPTARLLAELASLDGPASRAAAFVCTLVAVRHADDPEPLVAVGRWPGSILAQAHGTGGFGYDPLMYIPALGSSVAAVDASAKNRHSHRALAAAQMALLMREAWGLA